MCWPLHPDPPSSPAELLRQSGPRRYSPDSRFLERRLARGQRKTVHPELLQRSSTMLGASEMNCRVASKTTAPTLSPSFRLPISEHFRGESLKRCTLLPRIEREARFAARLPDESHAVPLM